MSFVLNIDELIIIHINLNDQINKRFIRVVLYYSVTNWVLFELTNLIIT